MIFVISLLFILFVASMIFVALSRVVVPPGHAYVVEKSKIFHKVLLPGTHWLAPIIDEVVCHVPTTPQSIQIDKTPIMFKTGKMENINIKLVYQVTNPKAFAYSPASSTENAITMGLVNATREILGQIDKTEFVENVSHYMQAIDEKVSLQISAWGIRIESFTMSIAE